MQQTLILGALSALGLLATFLFQWLLVFQTGPGLESDLFFASATIPQILQTIAGGPLLFVLTPYLSKCTNNEFRSSVRALALLIGGAFFLLTSVLYASASFWATSIFPSLSAGPLIEMCAIQSLALFFTGLASVATAAYNAQKRFIPPVLSQFIAGASSLVVLYLAMDAFGIVGAAWAAVYRAFAQLALLIPTGGLLGACAPRQLPWRNIAQQIKPLILSNLYYKSDPLLDRYLLATLAPGQLSLYQLVTQIYSAGAQVLNKAISNPALAQMSHQAHSGPNGIKRIYSSAARVLWIVSLGYSISLTFIIWLGLSHIPKDAAQFSPHDLHSLLILTACMAGMFISSTVNQVTSAAFYAMGDTRTPTRITLVTYTGCIILKIISFKSFGAIGLALASSAYCVATLTAQSFVLKNRLHSVNAQGSKPE